jgi:polar amino acid transport system substrate-binding protein
MNYLAAIGFILIAISSSALQASEVKLTLVTENSSPMNMMQDGKMVGPSADILREVMRRAGFDFSLQAYPWKRAYMMASQQRNTCVYPTTRTPSREAQFKWVGPIGVTEWVLYAAADKQIRIDSIEQARPFLIGTHLGDSRDEYFRGKGYRVDSVADDHINPQKLLAHRIDLWAASPSRASALLNNPAFREKIVPVLRFNRVDLFLACQLELAPEVLKQMEEALQQMQADGSAKAIVQKYQN